jgi:hypothetical protein
LYVRSILNDSQNILNDVNDKMYRPLENVGLECRKRELTKASVGFSEGIPVATPYYRIPGMIQHVPGRRPRIKMALVIGRLCFREKSPKGEFGNAPMEQIQLPKDSKS